MARTWYVTPSGSSSNNGNSYATAVDIKTAMAGASAGDVVLLQPGTYKIANSGSKNGFTMAKTGSASSTIRIEGDGGQAVINFQWGVNAYLKDDHGLSVTGSYYYFKNLMITQAGYNGAYVTGAHNTFENCVFYNNRNTGLEINNGGSYTTVLNCDAYYNYDLRRGGGMADGFGPKQKMGPGNVLTGCRSWENSDDGFDLFDSPEKVIIKNCWTFRNGINVYTGVTQWGTKDGTGIDGVFKGNGNGFKLGGNGAAGNHEVYNCVSFENVVKGFDQNNNKGGVKIYNSTGYNNGTYNFAFGGTLNSGEKNDFRNNLSVGSPSGADVKNATLMNNSWTLGIKASSSDFVNLTTSLAKVARNADGSLPYTGLFVPVSSSKVVDAGVNVSLPYCGKAPELGAFEINCATNNAPVVSISSPANNATFTAPASITINATASDADGSVSNVQFYYGKSLLGSDNSSPYSYSWTNVVAGTYTITAIATDDKGATTTSSAITIIVNAVVPPSLTLTAGSATQIVTSGTAITNIVYTWGGSATDVTVTGLPAGLTATKNTSAKTVTISGTPTASGTFTLTTVQPSGTAVVLTGTITVTVVIPDPTLALTSGSSTQTVTSGSAISSIVYTWGGSATDVTVTGLPTGLTATKNTSAKTVTISGTPTASGTFTLTTVQPSGTAVVLTGTITVEQPLGETIQLFTGWNYIGCPIVGSTSIEKALSSIWSNVLVVKNFDAFWDVNNASGLNSLTKLNWGYGYLIKVSANCTLDWTLK